MRALASVAPLLLFLAGCGGEEISEGRRSKVVLVGVDGWTFSVLDPMLERGELPNLARLIEGGVRADLRSVEPMISPALWTTIATGRSRSEHGIEDFVLDRDLPPEEQVLMTSRDRRTLALWNIASGMERTVGVSGWWATWPTESVDGWMVSDRLTRSRWSEWTDGVKESSATFPPSLLGEIEPLVRDPLATERAEIEALVELEDAEWVEFEAARRPVFGHGLGVLKFAWATQRSHEEIVLAQLAKGQPDLLVFLLIANDPISHTFWHHYEPERFPGVDPDEAERLGAIVPGIARHNDRFLGRLLDALEGDTVVLIASDHGFKASGRVPRSKSSSDFGDWFAQEELEAAGNRVVAIGQSGKHDDRGVFIASGGPITPGVALDTVEQVDIAPTVLALLGLPVADDLEGRVLDEAIDPSYLAASSRPSVPTYEGMIERTTLESDDEGDDGLDMIRSLGYVN